ncbi:hypothetical protein BXY53_2641 [Dichotomicrobium thermohalophilum]|uniref:Uncharacterized protein n=1 Tax=Dichotomicrobium thermohalophilum TaxID=933063 RepID=A0A397PHA2_9HYPH|nr:hypothetical protein BXY53_2641 [Dichotomicrobium thermohalophilum]
MAGVAYGSPLLSVLNTLFATGLAAANASHVKFASVPSEFASCVTDHLLVGASGQGDFHNENSSIAPQYARWRIYSDPGTALGSP